MAFSRIPTTARCASSCSTGALPLPEFFGQLLRLVYRLIFLLAAEDRNLLHPPDVAAAARKLYAEGYSVGALRDRAVRRAAWDRHHDRWEGLLIAFAALARGETALGLPRSAVCSRRTPFPISTARGSPTAPDGGDLPPRLAARAVRPRAGELARHGDRGAGLGLREPARTHAAADRRWSRLRLRRGRRGQGPCPQDHAAATTRPTVWCRRCSTARSTRCSTASRPRPTIRQQRSLSVTVLDPACGSGHFLLAAARRIATRVARARAGGVASPADYRHALRDVVRACIHGVDRNPMAVELTKVALWIETVEPGKPLGFLDANIRCGDALLGVFDLDALADGIPDAAYKPLAGDDKETAKHFARRNNARARRPGQPRLRRRRSVAGGGADG